MIEYGCRILLKHDEAQDFFEKAKHPDIETLQRRDSFFARIREELSCVTEGTDLIEVIPDIDIACLLNPENSYNPAKAFLSAISGEITHITTNYAEHSNYSIRPAAKVQAA